MRHGKALAIAAPVILGNAAATWAEGGAAAASRGGGVGLILLAFFGLCALVIVAQAVPTLIQARAAELNGDGLAGEASPCASSRGPADAPRMERIRDR